MIGQVGKYELGRALGAGGMAEVFVATIRGAEGFTRPVAIKRVLAEHSRQPAFAAMFVDEARLAARLRHDNVVQTLDFDRDDDGRLYLVMELVEGRDLDQLAAAGRLPWPVLVHVLAGVLRGLGHAHDLVVDGKPLLVVHRDVSPHNVLLSWDGTVKVSDFGIAKAMAATGATRSGAIKGKPAYMSPEQITGGDLDGRSDLFAVGVMMWELLAGRPLFAGGSLEETFARVLHQPITPPGELVAGLPAELDAIVMTLLARDRDQRFQHARDAVAALEASPVATLQGRELLADLLAERFPDRAPPRTSIRPAGGVRTPIATPAAGRAARSRARPIAVVVGVVLVLVVGALLFFATRSRRPIDAAAGNPDGDARAIAIDAAMDAALDATIEAARSPDAGLPLDAGRPLDAGLPLDAGRPLDAGLLLDAGRPLDAGLPLGAGRRVRAPDARSTIQDIPLPRQ